MKGIFIWRAQVGQEDEFVRRWETQSQSIQMYPGARGTLLHRSVDDPRLFVGYPSWDSLQDRVEAFRRREADGWPPDTHDEISEVLFTGFFDDPYISVQPQPYRKPS